MLLFFSSFSSSFLLLFTTFTLRTLKVDLKSEIKCSFIILSSDKTFSSEFTLLSYKFFTLKEFNKLLNKCKYELTLLVY